MKVEMISKFGLSFVFSALMLSTVAFAQGFQDLISTFKEIGVFQFYLPFILVFTVLYALLLKTNIFGSKENVNKPLVTIISLAAAAFIMVYVPIGITFSQFLTNFFGNVVIVILTLVALVILASILTSGGFFNIPETFTKGAGPIVVLVLLLLVVFGVFVASGGTSIFPGIKISANPVFDAIGGFSPTTLAIIILVVGTGLIVWLLGKKPA